MTGKKKRGLQEINAGSMADIAFLLLIFFLITTTMASEQGILNLLPPKVVGDPPKIKPRNVLTILVNQQNYLLVENNYMNIEDLAEFTEKFILNNGVDPNMSESPDKAVISIKNDRGTSYKTYVDVQNELRRAYNKVRDDYARNAYAKTFDDCTDAQQKYIKDVIPQKISEAESTDIGGDL